MKDILTELGKEIRKDISGRKPKDKVTDHPFLSVRVPFLQLLINTILPLSSVLVWTINYVATPPKGMGTET